MPFKKQSPISWGEQALREPPQRWQELALFRGIDPATLERLAGHMAEVRFEQGDVLMTQGEPGDVMYIVTRGVVRVVAERRARATAFQTLLTAPVVVGEVALVTGEPRSASVGAETPLECLRIDRPTLDRLVAANPAARTILTTVIGQRLLEADTIAHVGKYPVTGRLGAGSQATVFEAHQESLDRPVALKMLSHSLIARPGFREGFLHEGKRVARLDHEHIVRVFDTVEAYGTLFIVMEKLSGDLLEDLIEQGTRLPWGAVRRILKEICLALAYSHERGLLHRDVKPSNVFLTADRRVKLLDFGVAIPSSEANQASAIMGTPYYVAPEMIRQEPLDGRSDLYSVGILAYELITGEVPFDAETLEGLWVEHLHRPIPDPRETGLDVPDDLVAFVRRAAAKDPAERFPSCAAAAEFLQVAAELPLVNALELATLSIAYHPVRKAEVLAALERLRQEIAPLAGVKLRVDGS